MVLQRWQTVLLFLAFVLMTVFCVTPLGYDANGESVFAWFNIPFMVLNVVTALLLFIDIFLYRNLRLQMRWAVVVMLLQAVSAGLGFAITYFTDGMSTSLCGAPMVVAALVLTWFARRFMDKDRKLLAAADRIR